MTTEEHTNKIKTKEKNTEQNRFDLFGVRFLPKKLTLSISSSLSVHHTKRGMGPCHASITYSPGMLWASQPMCKHVFGWEDIPGWDGIIPFLWLFG
jgi:hypothetical protein